MWLTHNVDPHVEILKSSSPSPWYTMGLVDYNFLKLSFVLKNKNNENRENMFDSQIFLI